MGFYTIVVPGRVTNNSGTPKPQCLLRAERFTPTAPLPGDPQMHSVRFPIRTESKIFSYMLHENAPLRLLSQRSVFGCEEFFRGRIGDKIESWKRFFYIFSIPQVCVNFYTAL